MSIISMMEIAKRAEEKADFAVKRAEEATNGWLAIAGDVTKIHKRFDELELLVKQSLQEQENHKITHLRDELREAQRRYDSLRAGEMKTLIERGKDMNNKWVTIIGALVGAGGMALTLLAQQHVVGASVMGVAVAITALGKSLMEASAK